MCKCENCDEKIYAKGLCKNHYAQHRRYGHTKEILYIKRNLIIPHDNYAELIIYKKFGESIVSKIDLDSIPVVSQYQWHVSSAGYVCFKMKKALLLHRLLCNNPEGLVIDHINHDKLDNRKLNLRICTQKENLRNTTRIPRSNKTNEFGICMSRDRYYIVQLLGEYRKCFTNLNDAILLRNSILEAHDRDFSKP